MARSYSVIALALAFLSACSSKDPDAEAPSAGSLVFNEISAAGAEWLELYNTQGNELDLSGFAVTDSDQLTGEPRPSKAMRFPSGTTLPGHGFLLVLLGKTNSIPGPYSAEACLPEIGVGCFYASFSISQTRAEVVHLLGPDGSRILSVTYPADLAFDGGASLTACRVPDGGAGLGACRATPGTSNQAL